MSLIALTLACTAATEGDTDTGTDAGSGGDSDTWEDIESPDILINEFLASNNFTNADNAGEYDDWVEIYNAGDRIVQMSGFVLTDDEDKPQQWYFPEGVGLAAGDFLLVWCDGQEEQSTTSELHTNFRLDRETDVLHLWYYEGDGRAAADLISWTEPQAKDRSAQRVPDGRDDQEAWVIATPTPEAPNAAD